MPWSSRLVRKRPLGRLHRIVRRWRREHDEDLPSLCIGLVVIAATLIALKLLKVL